MDQNNGVQYRIRLSDLQNENPDGRHVVSESDNDDGQQLAPASEERTARHVTLAEYAERNMMLNNQREERNRRQQLHDGQTFLRNQQERELIEELRNRRKNKEERKLAKERVKDQIIQDRKEQRVDFELQMLRIILI